MTKRIFLSVLILVSVFALGALGIEDALKTIFTYSEVIEHEGDEVLMTSSFFDNEGDARHLSLVTLLSSPLLLPGIPLAEAE